MATGALHRGVAEIYVLESPFQCRRPVAIRTRYCSMGAQQGKLGLRMIETPEFMPLDRSVACFASRRPPVRAPSGHLFAELAGVRIIVACSAGAILKLEFHGND
jgi:hypothetical protein